MPTPDNIRILVAEDNEFYQKVILHQLKNLGYRADITKNGYEALKYWQNEKYDLLLTDIHMPQMDGHELATRIRKAEQKTGQHTLIIAFSASYREGGRPCFPETGIDGFISKPVEMTELQQILEKVVSKNNNLSQLNIDKERCANNGLEGNNPDTHVVEDKAKLVDSTHVRKLIEQLGQSDFNYLLSALIEDTPPRFNELREAMKQNDDKAIHEHAHALASSFGFMGLSALYQHTRALSEAGRSGPVEDVHDRVATIEATFTQTIDLLRVDYSPQPQTEG